MDENLETLTYPVGTILPIQTTSFVEHNLNKHRVIKVISIRIDIIKDTEPGNNARVDTNSYVATSAWL